MPADISALLGDLADENAALDAILAGRPESDWKTPTPAVGWDVTDTISHLYFFDGQALLALTDPAEFGDQATKIFSGGLGPTFDVDPGRAMGGPALLDAWRDSRTALLDALRAADPSERVAWYGPAMSLASFTTARIMEAWAHGMDVTDALDAPPVVSDRLRHICHIGVGARAYSYVINGMTDPGHPVRVELRGPSGDTWSWGDEAATNRVSGDALDFALVVVQRRHLADTALRIEGPVATEWMPIAQSFAGPHGDGRQPGARPLSQS